MRKTLALITVLFVLEGCTSPIDHSVTNVHVSLAVAYLQQGDLEKGRKILISVLALQDNNPAAWSAMAYLEEKSGNEIQAAEAYQKAIRLNPLSGEAHNNYGVFLCRHQNPKEGLQEILKATRLSRYIYRSSAYENASLCAKKIPDFEAARIYHQAAERNAGKYDKG
jgi:type IV pilus assembly protein PilF